MEWFDTYKVYIKTNDNNLVTAINSSAFLSDTTGWIKIDEGTGDKYHHAQGNYLPKGLVDDNGSCNYKYVDGVVIERSLEDKQSEVDRIYMNNEILDLKRKLNETDYIAAKIAEGAATKEEYAEQIAERASWRQHINELEVLINA